MGAVTITSTIVTATAGAVVAAFTVVLANVGKQQVADTRILQRAYLSVEPRGIVTHTNGLLIGQVAFKNVGKLPATVFINIVMDIVVHHGNWATPMLTDSAFRDNDEDPGLVGGGT